MAIRPIQRENLAHHICQGIGHLRLHPGLCHFKHRSEVLRYGRFCNWYLCGQLDHLRLGCVYLRTDEGKESQFSGDCEHHSQRLVHLVCFSGLPTTWVLTSSRTPYLWPSSDEPRYVIAMTSSAAFSFATAAGGELQDLRKVFMLTDYSLGHAILASKIEQEDHSVRQRDCLEICLLTGQQATSGIAKRNLDSNNTSMHLKYLLWLANFDYSVCCSPREDESRQFSTIWRHSYLSLDHHSHQSDHYG